MITDHSVVSFIQKSSEKSNRNVTNMAQKFLQYFSSYKASLLAKSTDKGGADLAPTLSV